MEQLSERIKALPVSATIRMASMARELRSQGKDIVDLSLGEPDFDTPEHIKKAAWQAMQDGYTSYTPVPGFLSLREALSAKFKRDNGLDYSPEQIVVSNGAKQSLANLALCLVNPGDEVILPAPYWVSYAAIAQLAEAVQVTIPTTVESNFKISPEQLEAAITDRTRMIIMSSPCNPSGSVYSKEELAGLAAVIKRHPKVFVAYDEIYEYINFTEAHHSLAAFEEIHDQVITVNGFSKGFAMTGWRIGYIGAPEWIAKACAKMQGQFTSGACSISQKAAEHAISSDLGPTMEMKAAFLQRRNMMYELLGAIPGFELDMPEGAFYFFPNVKALFGKRAGERLISDADELSMYLLEEAGVSVVTGSPFGSPNCIRLSYAASEEQLREAVRRISVAVSKLS